MGSVVLVTTGAGQGTGFVFDDGHVVTNAHVVGTAGTAQMRFREGEWRTGEVVGTDAYSDLAAISLPDRPAYAAPLPFIDGDPVVGQEVVVLGNPFGLDGTATTGIVSGVNRSIPSPAGFSIPDAVQTDAAVNPGNSGGPIVSLDDEVIAVINSGGGDNVAFGISAALTRRVVPELVASGEYEHAYMGVSLRDVTPAVATANDLDRPRGVIVEGVVPGGPADGVLRGATTGPS
ncbi:S1C family serine protease [Halobacteriaceae archaeon GCM10025711]